MFFEVVRLEREADDDLTAGITRSVCSAGGAGRGAVAQDVRVRHEFQHELATAVLDFLFGRVGGAVVRYRRAMHDGVRRFKPRHHGVVHLPGALHAGDFDSARERGLHRACDDFDFEAVGVEYRGERDGSLTAAAVGNVTYRIDGFFGAARGEEHLLAVTGESSVLRGRDVHYDGKCRRFGGVAGEPPARRGSGRRASGCSEGRALPFQKFHNLCRFHQAPLPDFAASEFTGRRFEYGRVFEAAQDFEVAFDGGAVVHRDVHRGRHHARARAAHEAEAHRVVGDSAGELADDIRGRGHHQIEVGPAREIDMLEGTRLDGSALEVDGALGEARERKRGHEFGGGVGHAHAHLGTLLLQKAQQFAAFVHGDSARDPEKDFLSSQFHIQQDRKRPAWPTFSGKIFLQASVLI